MTRLIATAATAPLGLQDFMREVEHTVRPEDLDSVAAAAPLLGRLATDRELVLRHLNPRLANYFNDKTTASAQSIPLGAANGCTLRANVWPTEEDLRAGRMVQLAQPYFLAQDQASHLLSAGFYGPGYQLDTFRYDEASVVGYAGEPVRLHALESAAVAIGRAVLVAAGEVMVRRPPPALSITLDLVVPAAQRGERRQFDLVRSELQHRAGTPQAIRASIVQLASAVGDDTTAELLLRLSREHSCPRTRLAAFQALTRLRPADAAEIWRSAATDPAPLVQRAAAAHAAA